MFYERWLDQEDRLNYRSSIIAAYIANSVPRGKGGRRKAIQAHDVIAPLRQFAPTEHINTVDDQVAALKMFFGEAAFQTEDVI